MEEEKTKESGNPSSGFGDSHVFFPRDKFLTKGDANPVDDRFLYGKEKSWITRDQIVGRVVWYVWSPGFLKKSYFSSSQNNFILEKRHIPFLGIPVVLLGYIPYFGTIVSWLHSHLLLKYTIIAIALVWDYTPCGVFLSRYLSPRRIFMCIKNKVL
jgi:hypothetical protein